MESLGLILEYPPSLTIQFQKAAGISEDNAQRWKIVQN